MGVSRTIDERRVYKLFTIDIPLAAVARARVNTQMTLDWLPEKVPHPANNETTTTPNTITSKIKNTKATILNFFLAPSKVGSEMLEKPWP